MEGHLKQTFYLELKFAKIRSMSMYLQKKSPQKSTFERGNLLEFNFSTHFVFLKLDSKGVLAVRNIVYLKLLHTKLILFEIITLFQVSNR